MQQGVFREYKQPFVVAYLATSLLVVYLPVAFIKDCLLEFLRCHSCKSVDDAETVDESSMELDSTAKQNGKQVIFEIEHQEKLGKEDSCVDVYSEDVKLLVSESAKNIHTLKDDKKITTKEIAKFGFCIAPLWFFTEVRSLHVSVISSWSLHLYHLTYFLKKKKKKQLIP